MTGGQANFLQSLGWAVLNSLWQLALLWVIYQLVTGLFKKTRSSSKSSLATILLLGGFAWFIYTFFSAYLSQGSTAGAIASSPLVNATDNPELSNWLQQSLPVASVIYLVLLVFPLLHFVRNYRYVQLIRRFGLSKMDVHWRIFVQKIAAQLGIKKPVHIWVSECVSSPVTIGFLKPVILVPLAAINHLTPQQIEAVLLHELSHIRRFDYIVNLVINFIQTILYFNPFAKAFVKIVEKEREKSCDEMVMQFQYDSHDYASALLTLEKANFSPRTLVVGAAGKKNDLLTRIEIILGVHKKPILSFNKLAGFMAGILCIIALNTLLIISKPVAGKGAIDIASLSSPENFFTPVETDKSVTPAGSEQPVSTVVNHATRPLKKVKKGSPEPVTPAGYIVSAFNNPEFNDVNMGLQLASFETLAEIPVLKKYQEVQVKEALEASKKVLENKQWKVVEKNIADVFTQKEKEVLKATYHKELEKYDWEKLGDKLRMVYENIDWETVNTQLTAFMNQVRLDSLQQVYVEAIVKLNQVQNELVINNISAIPDTDISLKVLEEKKVEVQRVLSKLKAVRTKKTVHL